MELQNVTQHGNRFFADDVKAWNGSIQDYGRHKDTESQTRQMTNGGRENAVLKRWRLELGF